MGINKCLIYTAKDRVIKDLLRHELAHYFTYIGHHASGIETRIPRRGSGSARA
jgi:predicted SprT family Zn-dependent metalloprotease